MNTLAIRLFLTLALFVVAAFTVADEEISPTKIRSVQVIRVNGTDLTGLNGSALTSRINQAKQNGATGIVVDLGTVSHMTPAGMESLTTGAQSIGAGNFAVANLSGQPAQLAQNGGAGLFHTYSSVQEAVAALRE